jgi:P27 family predicted phage terminase small subunit
MTALKAHKPKTAPAPVHLGPRGKAFWNETLSAYAMDETDLPLVQAAAEQLDRAESARLQIEREGLTTKDRFGQVKSHPAVEIERQAHLAYVRIRRELGLDVAPADSRPPLPRGYR